MTRCPRCGYLAELDPDPLDVQPVGEPASASEDPKACLPALLFAGLLVAGLVLAVVRLLGG